MIEYEIVIKQAKSKPPAAECRLDLALAAFCVGKEMLQAGQISYETLDRLAADYRKESVMAVMNYGSRTYLEKIGLIDEARKKTGNTNEDRLFLQYLDAIEVQLDLDLIQSGEYPTF